MFDGLFVLELANNHLGSLKRGRRIIRTFAEVVKASKVQAAIKLQFRDVDSFLHKAHAERQDVRYIRKVAATRLDWRELEALVEETRACGLTTMTTPFDEVSVGKVVQFGVEILKIASSDIADKSLTAKIADAGLPVIASTGGSSLADIDNLVGYFAQRRIPLALNHCVSIYPSRDDELDLNQIDFLRGRYPDLTIGFSTHEMTDWRSSMLIAYAKGARTFERHIDIDDDGVAVSPYCTLPHQAAEWFAAYHKAREMCGGSAAAKRAAPEKEIRYLDQLVRGLYAKRALPAGHILAPGDVYLAAPLQHGQVSCREFEGGERLKAAIAADGPIHVREVDAPWADDLILQRLAADRGVPDPEPAVEPRQPRRVYG